jgi:hypothetical protein
MDEVASPAAPLRGYLVIHVGGYKHRLRGLVHLIADGGTTYSIPDRLLDAPVHPAGTSEWFEDGWAVGDNARGQFCSWQGGKPRMQFAGFDEAVAYVHRMRVKRKRPHEVYTLVYVIQDAQGRECSEPVSSTDEIAAIEARIADEKAEVARVREVWRTETAATFPEREALQARFGRSRGVVLSAFLGKIRHEGLEAAKVQVSRSTFYRNLADLRAAELL